MRQRRKEQKIKYWLSLTLKILLILLAIIKLLDWRPWEGFADRFRSGEQTVEQKPALDGINSTAKEIKKQENDKPVVAVKPIANSASIYIFNQNGLLDSQTSRHIGSFFFNDFILKGTPQGFLKEELLLGNLNSSANTELVCVGSVSYSYSKNSLNGTTCVLDIYFDTYNKSTGEKVKHLSKSFFKKGVGVDDDKHGAKQMAMGKVHP